MLSFKRTRNPLVASVDKDDIAKPENYIGSAFNDLATSKAIATSVTKLYGCTIKYAD